MLQIAVISESTAIADADVQAMIPAFNTQWNNDLNSVWGVGAATFAFTPKKQAPPAGSWWVVFLDNSDQANALAYHDLTNEGLPISKVFVKTIQADKASLSVGASHEICEMAVDPWLNSAYQDARGTFWAGEICDPVEDDQYGYPINGVAVSDFVLPSYFEPNTAGHTKGVKFDYRGELTQAVPAMLSGGYLSEFDVRHGGGWTQKTAATEGQPHRGHLRMPKPGGRSDKRRRPRQDWKNTRLVPMKNA